MSWSNATGSERCVQLHCSMLDRLSARRGELEAAAGRDDSPAALAYVGEVFVVLRPTPGSFVTIARGADAPSLHLSAAGGASP